MISLKVSIGVSLAAACCFGQEYIISTVAGGGPPDAYTAAAIGDGGPAMKASLHMPRGIAVDSAGNIYIADSGHRAVRKVTVDGTISTIVGGPQVMFNRRDAGDGRPGIAVGLWDLGSVAVDAKGNLYVASDGRVRRVSPAGIVNTVAGGGLCNHSEAGDDGPAIRAYIEHPQGLSFDQSGNLFIADTNTQSHVLKMLPSGTISTVAGRVGCGEGYRDRVGFSGDGGPALQAKMQYPTGTAIDAEGNLYIAESENYRIRRVDRNGIITTVAGNGERGSAGFRKNLSGVNAALATQVGILPSGIVADTYGNLFIADHASGCVWMMTRDGRVHVIAGDYMTRELRDGGPAVKARLDPVALAIGPGGRIYVADFVYDRIRLLTPTRPPAPLTTSLQGAPGSSLSPAEPFRIAPLDEAHGAVSIPDIRNRMAAAIASNGKLYKNLLYKWQMRAEFSGTTRKRFPTFGGDSGEPVHTEMPAFKGHFQAVDGRPVTVLDGWEDRAPFPERDIKRRIMAGAKGEPETLDVVQELLGPSHSVTIVGLATHRGGQAYVIESLPAQALIARLTSPAARCAAVLKATVFIDATSLFPIRMDAETVTPRMCSDSGYFPLDATGTRDQTHFVKVTRQDPCGDRREIWLMDAAVQETRTTGDGWIAFPGSIAERKWPLGPEYRGGEFKSTTVRSDFQIFVTGACVSFGEVVESKPVESVHSDVRFELDDVGIPFRQTSSSSGAK